MVLQFLIYKGFYLHWMVYFNNIEFKASRPIGSICIVARFFSPEIRAFLMNNIAVLNLKLPDPSGQLIFLKQANAAPKQLRCPPVVKLPTITLKPGSESNNAFQWNATSLPGDVAMK